MYYYFSCPHCGIHIQVPKNQVNCQIFRCGVYKESMQQLPPHANRQLCDKVLEEGLIWGCGRPFKFDKVRATKCDYI